MQVVKKLIENGVAVNKKNNNGLTARDILEHQSQLGKQELKSIMSRAGALTSSALDTIRSSNISDHLISYVRSVRSAVDDKRNEIQNMPGDRLNALLVILVLMAIATYQATLPPIGGVCQDKYLNINTSPSSSPIPAPRPHRFGKSILGLDKFIAFSALSYFTFFSSIFLIFLFLLYDNCGTFVRVYLISLFGSYMASLILTIPFKEW